MTETREKFATQIDSTLLKEVRSLAKDEGRQLQALMDEALADLLEKRKQTRPRRHVMAAYERSLGTYFGLYEKLAK